MVGPWLSGNKVNLRPLRDMDASRRVEWLSDAETVRLFTGSWLARTYERADAERWRQTLEADPMAVVWAIETKEHRHIGDVDLHAIDHQVGLAKLTILIGDRGYWSSGYGTDAVKTLLRHAFRDMGLQSVSLRVYDFNRRAIHCYEKCGFSQVGSGSRGPWLVAEPGEIYMTVAKEHFFAENPDASLVHA